VDSFGFGCYAKVTHKGARRTGKVINRFAWVSVPAQSVEKLRYRDIYANRVGHLMVQDIMGVRTCLEKVVPDYLLHSEPVE